MLFIWNALQEIAVALLWWYMTASPDRPDEPAEWTVKLAGNLGTHGCDAFMQRAALAGILGDEAYRVGDFTGTWRVLYRRGIGRPYPQFRGDWTFGTRIMHPDTHPEDP